MEYIRIFYVIFLVELVTFSQSSNILIVLPTPSFSHQVAYTELWKELSLRGHKVTVITTDPLNDAKLTNLTEIDMHSSYEDYKQISRIAENSMNKWNAYRIFFNLGRQISRKQLSHPQVQDLIHSGKKFDVVLTEFIYPEYLAFAELYSCPKIVICSMDANMYFHKVIGNPTHPALHPELVATFFPPLNFQERIVSSLLMWYLSYFYIYEEIPQRQEIIKTYFNVSTSLHQLISDVDLLMINANPVIQGARAVGPTTINIGGHRSNVYSNSISKDLKDFLDSAKEGFIYFSLGSNVKSKELNKDTFNAIKQTLSEVPYKVLWKFEDDNLPGKPDNVKLVKWAPQQNVLSHPNIKLFVTQGGLQSMEEAIYSEVPCVVIPFFADQEQNAKLMETRGFAKIVGRIPSVDKTELKTAILEVLNNPKYKNAVVRLKQLALDTPMTGLEKAIWWIEYVIRNNGTKHLRNPAADIPTYQYYLLDVIGFLFVTVGLVLYVAFVAIKTIISLLKNRILPKFVLEKKKLQ